MSLEKNAAFGDMSDLLNASMDELEALPPMQVPPSGHYLLNVQGESQSKEGKEYIALKFTVITVNEVKAAEEADDVKPGQLFNKSIYLKKKDGSTNTMAIGEFVTFCSPFREALFGGQSVTVGEMLARLSDGAQFSTSLVRTSRKDANGEIMDDAYNFRFKDVVVV